MIRLASVGFGLEDERKGALHRTSTGHATGHTLGTRLHSDSPITSPAKAPPLRSPDTVAKAKAETLNSWDEFELPCHCDTLESE